MTRFRCVVQQCLRAIFAFAMSAQCPNLRAFRVKHQKGIFSRQQPLTTCTPLIRQREAGSYVAFFDSNGLSVGETGVVYQLANSSYLWAWADSNGARGVHSNDGITELTFRRSLSVSTTITPSCKSPFSDSSFFPHILCDSK